MELGVEVITENSDETFSLSVTFVLAAAEFQNTPHLSLTAQGEKELSENITTIEYGFAAPAHGDEREGDYRITIQAEDGYVLNPTMNRVELTKTFTLKALDKNVDPLEVIEDIARIFEDEIVPAFSNSDEAPKLARLPAVER